jgi:pimeloyl-ACP methyl ester carboxylesterase
MDYVAQRGWDVYIMDLRGYGRSTRPSEMSKPAAENPPIVNTDVAVKDVGAVVDHILARRKVQRLNLLGHSWGTAIMGAYTAANNVKIEGLVLYGPMWLLKDAPPMGGGRSSCRIPNGIPNGYKGGGEKADGARGCPGEAKRTIA